MRPTVAFAGPRQLPRAKDLAGRVVVIDIAFASEGLGKGFDKSTGRFIAELGARLARWVDHHDHPRHADFVHDDRFVLARKQEHGACPEMITPELVAETGPIDTILCHFDLDGIYGAAKWILGGREPYVGADADARAVDTRVGEVGPVAVRIDRALRAHFRDPTLKQRIVNYLVGGMKAGAERDAVEAAARDFDRMEAESARLAGSFVVEEGVALVRIPAGAPAFDKTNLLLLGQQRAEVAVVVEGANASIAAAYDSGLNFVELLELGGGMPTRVSIPDKQLAVALARIRAELAAPRRRPT